MAQLARLNLRMQKELKILLTDPPPGASFPSLSSDSDLSAFSLSNIIAQIEGPEDSVYAKGIFKLKIQIPDRYPFQPPIVTFATPIYHPNIDNGGRICLDILNLPPKGAWQPSLNISAVLTSIGLLLCEPNPDDGLMCEASKEYKYNRQAFDLKARSMTEKYARAGASENHSGNQHITSHSNVDMMETKGSESGFEVDVSFGSREKLCPLSRKLSLESSVAHQKNGNDNKENESNINHIIEKEREAEAKQQHHNDMFKDNLHHGKLNGSRRKLSLESLGSIQKMNTNKVAPNQCFSVLNPSSESLQECSSHFDQQSHQQLHKDEDVKSLKDRATNVRSNKICSDAEKSSLHSMELGHRSDRSSEKMLAMLEPSSLEPRISGPLPLHMSTNPLEKQPQKDCSDRIGSGFPSVKHKRLGLAGKRPLGQSTASTGLDNNKENMAPVPNTFLSNSRSGDRKACNSDKAVASKKLCRTSQKNPLEPIGKINGSSDTNTQLNLSADNLTATPVELLPATDVQKKFQDHEYRFTEQIKEQREGSPTPDSVIVLDSEDSDEEKVGTLRSKLSLSRKRLLRKRNAKT